MKSDPAPNPPPHPSTGADFMSVADDADDHLFSALSSQSPFFVVGLYILSNPDPDLRKRVKLKLLPISTPDASAVLLFRGRSCVRLRVREIKNTVKRVWRGCGEWGVGRGLSRHASIGLTVTARMRVGGRGGLSF